MVGVRLLKGMSLGHFTHTVFPPEFPLWCWSLWSHNSSGTMNAWMEEAGVKRRGEVIYFGWKGRTGWPYLTFIQTNFFWLMSLCTARFRIAEPTNKMAAKLGLAFFFFELISLSESAKEWGLRDVPLVLRDEFCCFVPCYHKSFNAAARLQCWRHWTSSSLHFVLGRAGF